MGHAARLRAPGSARCVLVVDRHRWFAQLVTERLQRSGVEVCAPAGERQVMLSAVQSQPDAAVVGIHPPGHDGLRLIRRLAAAVPGIRIVALVGGRSRVVADRALLAGAACCLTREGGLETVVSLLTDGPSEPTSLLSIPTLEDVKQDHIRAVLEWTDGNVSQAARLLGIHRASLQRMLHRMGCLREGVRAALRSG